MLALLWGIFPDLCLLKVDPAIGLCFASRAEVSHAGCLLKRSLLRVMLLRPRLKKKAPEAFDPLRPESFSCDHTFLRESLSICAYGMPAAEVRLSLSVFCCVLPGFPLRLGGH